ncbi:choice-of-anchor C family protein [Duganella sp. BJB488]|uniref:choice-of-anchor C family PEP-CTERM protein n=1 Tax=unclassified Duganella TaxID=2636909 RepID=UPI000E347E41|nr:MULTISPECIES: choice-of-anchor C family protein [unclassified Duganella]RFP20352.1 choice-of-anchor C family protein [Duganella sp. BJB489]RFP21204.1 choice-of-anchor C family protein [Duganella sp. BJB488]RFP33345.1 choice-of-anchor C family protein [Duganella sp. BJB480]
MKICKLMLAAAIAAASVSGAASAANLIQNGDFENVAGVNLNDYVRVGAGSGAIANWTVGGVSVDVINNSYNSISGNSIDMLGTPGPGVLSQSFNAVAGATYTLSFDLTHNPYSHGAGLDVFVGGNHYAFDGSTPVTNYSFNFTTTGGSQALVFSSVGGDGYSGAVLDNVSVTAAVPEPETYAMMLAGLGLVGAIARRRKAAR